MPFMYNNKVGSLIYYDHDRDIYKRVKTAYIGNGTDQGSEKVYRGGNDVIYHIDSENLLDPTATMWRWTGENVLENLDFIPTKDGYEFMGWSNSDEPCTPSGGGLYTELTMIGDPIELYANFKKKVTVTSYVYDAANPHFSRNNDDYIVYNNGNKEYPKFTISSTTMPNYTFKGWATDVSPYEIITYDNIVNREFSSNTTVYAIYHRNTNMLYGYSINGTVTRLEGAVAINANNTGLIGYPILTIDDPSKPEASFLGWSTDGTRNIAYAHITNMPILNNNLMFYSVFKYGDSPDPLDPTQTRRIIINGDHQQEGRIDGNDSNTWLRLYDENGNELSYDCSLFERVDASGVCSLDQGVGLYLRETYGGNQSYDGDDGSEPPVDKHGMLNGTFGNVLLELPESGTTTLCVGVMSNSVAYVSNVNVNGGVRLIGRTTVG